MGASDNDKDCKHEPEVIVEYDDWGILCKKCGCDIHDYVILTKTQHQLMQDVVKAGREYHKGGHHKDGCRAGLSHQCKCGRYALDKTLDALDKGE